MITKPTFNKRLMSFVLTFVFIATSMANPIIAKAGNGAKEYRLVDNNNNPVSDIRFYNDIISAIEKDNSDYSKQKTVILQTNDVHGAAENYSIVKSLNDKIDALNNVDTILIDCGDFLWSKRDDASHVNINRTKGFAPTILMNAVQYDYATIGNHEFEFKVDGLKRNTNQANFKITSANLYENNELMYAPNYVYTGTSGLKIGFFGLTAPETKGQSKGNITGITVDQNGDSRTKVKDNTTNTYTYQNRPLTNTAIKQIDNLQAQNVDLVIPISHLGVKSESSRSTLKNNRSVDLYYDLIDKDINKSVPLILDGHSHTSLTEGGANLEDIKNDDGSAYRWPAELGAVLGDENTTPEPVIQAGIRMPYIGVVIIDDASKTIEDRFLVETAALKDSGIEPDKDVDDIYQVLHDFYEAGKLSDDDIDKLEEFAKMQHEAFSKNEPLPTANDLKELLGLAVEDEEPTSEQTDDKTPNDDDSKNDIDNKDTLVSNAETPELSTEETQALSQKPSEENDNVVEQEQQDSEESKNSGDGNNKWNWGKKSSQNDTHHKDSHDKYGKDSKKNSHSNFNHH